MMIQEVIDALELKARVETAQKELDELTENLLRQFYEGEIDEVNSKTYGLHVDYRKLQHLMSNVGFDSKDDLDLNGWENDYWETYMKYTPDGTKNVAVYGCMADGSFSVRWSED